MERRGLEMDRGQLIVAHFDAGRVAAGVEFLLDLQTLGRRSVGDQVNDSNPSPSATHCPPCPFSSIRAPTPPRHLNRRTTPPGPSAANRCGRSWRVRGNRPRRAMNSSARSNGRTCKPPVPTPDRFRIAGHASRHPKGCLFHLKTVQRRGRVPLPLVPNWGKQALANAPRTVAAALCTCAAKKSDARTCRAADYPFLGSLTAATLNRLTNTSGPNSSARRWPSNPVSARARSASYPA
jgi:hypothetical protein